MNVISSTKLAKSLDGRAGAGLPSIIQRWPGRNSHEILPGLFLNWVIAGAAFAIRQLPGMAMFNPMMLSMAIGIAFHKHRRYGGLGQTGRNIQSPPAARYRHSPIRLSIDLKPARHPCR